MSFRFEVIPFAVKTRSRPAKIGLIYGFEDIGANCFSVSLLRKQIYTPRHALSSRYLSIVMKWTTIGQMAIAI